MFDEGFYSYAKKNTKLTFSRSSVKTLWMMRFWEGGLAYSGVRTKQLGKETSSNLQFHFRLQCMQLIQVQSVRLNGSASNPKLGADGKIWSSPLHAKCIRTQITWD